MHTTLGLTLVFLNIGGGELVLIALAALLLFGGDKLPELARGLGKGLREFKDASDGIKQEISDQINNYGKDLKVDLKEVPKQISSYADQQRQEDFEADAAKTTAAIPDSNDYVDGGYSQPDYGNYGAQEKITPSSTTEANSLPKA